MQVVIDYTPTPKQEMYHKSPADITLYGGAAGGGKEILVDTPIPTSNGFVRMGDLRVGDKVFGPDGKTHEVLMCSPIREHPAWRFVFDDGSEILCNGEHLWHTFTARELEAMTKRTDEYRARRRESRPSRIGGKKSALFTSTIAARNKENASTSLPAPTGSVKTADEIVATLRTKSGRANHAIPLAAPLSLPEADLPLDPYLLGLWLGDGDSRDCGFTSVDGLESAFADSGFAVVKWSKKYSYGINGLTTILRNAGVLGDKHIPEPYLWASAGQRLALLQGLLDTDGCCNASGSAEFCNTNKRIVDGVYHLICSLGMKCSVREGRAKCNGKDCGPKWTIKFTPSMPVFRLSRKLERQKTDQHRTTRFRYLVDVERVESVKMRCIAIDSDDHLYLAGPSFIATHNSKATVMDALRRCLSHANTHAYLFRRSYPELNDTLIKEARLSIPKELGQYVGMTHDLVLVNGSVMHFRHCLRESNMTDYQGAEIDWLYIDELTTFTKKIFDYLRTRLRTKKTSGIKPTIRCTTNPGGIGHSWVKAMFIKGAKHYEVRKQAVYSEIKKETKIVRVQYIPAYVTDNPHVSDDYLFELEQKPDALKKALLNGDWDSFEGQVFTEFTDDPEHYLDGVGTHVITPFPIPDHWPRYRSFDHGYTRPFSVGWWAVDPAGRMYRYREWYGCERNSRGEIEPDKGVKLSPKIIAQGIWAREAEERRKGLKVFGICDPSLSDASRGPSVIDSMAEEGVYFIGGDNTRLPGKMQFHERLRFRHDGTPMMYVFSECEEFIRVIRALCYDDIKVEDVQTKSEDHIYDEARYMFMQFPIVAIEPESYKEKQYNPLEGKRR